MMTRAVTCEVMNLRRTRSAKSWLFVCGLAMGLLLMFTGMLFAEEKATLISRERVKLVDLVPEIAPGLANLDLGRAPPPGRSRYFSYEEIASRLQGAGVSASRLNLPRGIRVESQARQFSTDELEQLVEAQIKQAMPAAIRLESIEVESPLVLSPTVVAGNVRLPQFMKKNGQQTQTGTVEILWGDQVALRLPVKMSVHVDAEIAGPVVKRGTNLTLSIRRGSVVISAMAQTLSTGRVGDVISVRVGVTKKVMSARLVTSDKAELDI